MTSAGGSPFHSETGTEARLAQTDRGLFPLAVERVTEPYRCCRLALSCWRGIDRGDENQLSVGLVGQASLDEIHGNLCFVVSEGLEAVSRNFEPCGHFPDRKQPCSLCDFPIGFRRLACNVVHGKPRSSAQT